LSALNEISEILARNASGQAIWEPLHHQLIYLFDTTSLFVGLYDAHRESLNLTLVSENGLRIHHEPIQLCGLSLGVIKHGQTLHFDDLSEERERLLALSISPDEREPGYGALSWMGIPLRDRNRQTIGLIAIQNDMPGAYNDDDLALLTTIAGQISLAIDNAFLLDAEQERRRIANILMDVGRVVSSTLQTNELLERIFEQMERLLNFDQAVVLLPVEADALHPSEDGQLRLVMEAIRGYRAEMKGTRLAFGAETLVSQVTASHQPVVIRDMDAHSQAGWSMINPRTRSWIGAPMLVQERVVGILVVEKVSPYYYSDEDTTTIFALARQAGVAIENARLLARSEESLQQVQKRARRLAIINKLAAIASSTLERDPILHSAAELLTDLFIVRHCSIALYDQEDHTLTIVAEHPDTYSLAQEITIADYPLLLQAFTERVPFAINELDDHALPEKLLMNAEEVQAIMLMPLITRDRFIGIIMMDTYDPDKHFDSIDREFAETVASQIAISISNAELYDQAIEANRLKSEFLANISHELRTPLNPIIGYTDLMVDGVYGEMSDKQVERLVTVNQSAKHLLNVISDLFDLSMIEAEQMELEILPVNIDEVIASVIDDIQPKADAKGLEFIIETPDKLPRLQGDTQRLNQALINITDNGVKFTAEGSVSFRVYPIKVEAGHCEKLPTLPKRVHDGTWLAISVQDSGIGIAPEDQNIIFDAFRQVDGSTIRKFEGTGLGLAIAQRLIIMHEGHIWIDSQINHGTTVHILLPTVE
ncbi:MAG: GAF domain-containing protein, partial [Aggregatilineales bacterium]